MVTLLDGEGTVNSNMEEVCRELASEGRIEEVGKDTYCVGSISADDMREVEESYARAFGKRRNKRGKEELGAYGRLRKEGW